MSRIRPFVRDDVEQVAALHHLVFVDQAQPRKPLSSKLKQAYADYFDNVFFRHPWPDDALPSLVCEEADGKLSGFLGVLPRRMLLRGRTVRVALSSQFAVDPARRTSGAGVRLLKAFLAGPQDLALTDEANDTSRALWEGLGGSTAHLYSVHWKFLFRPLRFAATRMTEWKRLSWLAWPARLAAGCCDHLAGSLMPERFRCSPSTLTAEPLDAATLLVCHQQFAPTRALWPDYDAASLTWLLDHLGSLKQLGALRGACFRDSQRAILGWYLYHLKPKDTSRVVQLVARPQSAAEVLAHLLHDAHQGHAAALQGRMEPQWMAALAQRRCLCHCGVPWMLIHARDAELLRAFRDGDVLLSSLEGEMCMRFRQRETPRVS